MAAKTKDIFHFRADYVADSGRLLGRGGMGTVHLYTWKVDSSEFGICKGQKLAVKKLDQTRDIRSLMDEAKILWDLDKKCEYILKLYGIANLKGGPTLLMEYMQYGNVSDFFLSFKSKVTTSEKSDLVMQLKNRVAHQVCTGMNFLHGLPKTIFHRDLKARNILLDDQLDVKICDFGLARMKQSRVKSEDTTQEFTNHRAVGTYSHLAPECFTLKKYSKKMDVYSFGIFLWELLTDQIPYPDMTDVLMVSQVLKGSRPNMEKIPSNSREFLKEMMKECWDGTPAHRPAFSKLLIRFQHTNITDNITRAVEFCKDSWETNRRELSDTAPKRVRSNEDEGERYLETSEWTFLLGSSQPRSRTLSDLRPSEACISSSSDNVSSTTTVKETEHGNIPDGASDVPLLANSVHYLDSAEILRNPVKRKGCWQILLLLLVLSLLIAGATFAVCKFVVFVPECCIGCFDISDPALQTNCSIKTVKSKARSGTQCEFSCRDGYILNDAHSVITCRSNGTWSGSLPYCRKVHQCRNFSSPANGGSYQCTDGFNERSTCSFRCKPGYRLRLPGEENFEVEDNMNITCKQDDVENLFWTGVVPYCEKMTECQKLTIDTSTVTSDCTTQGQDKFNGTVCHFSCILMSMALREGQKEAICSENGSWNISSEVECINACDPQPYSPHSSYKCSKGNQYSSTCNYTCDDDFVMVGVSKMNCQGSGPKIGTWSSKPPKCVCPSCRSGDKCQNSVVFQDAWIKMNETNTSSYENLNFLCSTEKPNGCQCREKKTNTIKQCNDKDSTSEACYHAFASVLLMMSYRGNCTLPCDAATMPPIC